MTRKVLAPIDIKNPQKDWKDFIFPDPSMGNLVLRGLKTNREWEYGMVILTSATSAHDIFNSIVDRGRKIESVDELMQTLSQYVKLMPHFKIGNVVKLNPESKELNFVLVFNSLTKPVE